MMLLSSVAHAEVMDKEPSLALIWVWGSTGAALSFIAARFKPWLLLFVIPPQLFFFFGFLYQEVRDPFVGPAILREAGPFYVVSAYGLALAAIVFALAGLWLHWRSRNQSNKPLHPTATNQRRE
jgi:hypothetical protein